MLLSCILAFFLNYSVFLNTTLNSALTQTMCGNLKVCTLTCWPFFVFTCSCTRLIFVLIVVGSIYCWTWLAIVWWVTIWSGECGNLLLNFNLPLMWHSYGFFFFLFYSLGCDASGFVLWGPLFVKKIPCLKGITWDSLLIWTKWAIMLLWGLPGTYPLHP